MILYRLLLSLIFPLLLLQALRKGGLRERLGGGAPTPPGLWVHGASVGELTSARGLIAALVQDGPVIVTSNTATARQMVMGWNIPGVHARFAPFDMRWTLARFRQRHRPRALILIESELWPNRMLAMAGRLAMVGARISEGSAAGWARRAPALMRQMLAGVTGLSAQDQASAARFVALGLPPERLAPGLMLKTAVPLQTRPLPFAPPCPRDRCLLAASTHPGDEALFLAAWPAAQAAGFETLILAPRHPDRGDALATLAPMPRRSRGDVATKGLYLADTLGEMDYWYRMAGVTLIGGTFSDRGGHTPYEPAAYGTAILHGPDVANFAEAFAALDKAGAAIATTAETLAPALAQMDAARQAQLTAAAKAILAGKVDLGPLLDHLRRVLP
jgi:3-deoxy-D-manno-octulosonic-acid transferase